MARLRLIVAVLALAFAAPANSTPVDRWSTFIAEASARFGVPRTWVEQIIRVESRGQAASLSPKGAMGLMQLMPRTWAEMRAELGLGRDPYDPHDNILAGTFYLKLMYGRFGYPGLFAAYNAGPSRYADYLAGEDGLPLETRAYVKAVQGSQASLVSASRRPRSNAPRPSSGLFFALSNATRD